MLWRPALLMRADSQITRTIELLGGPDVIEAAPATELDLHDILCRRLPAKAAATLVSNLKILPVEEPIVLEKVLGVSLDLLRRQSIPSSKRLDVARSWKVWEFARAIAKAECKFGILQRAETWLRSPSMGSRRPLDLMLTPVGAEMVQRELTELIGRRHP